MITEIRKLKDLLPAKYNPRKALKPGDEEYEKLKRSIQEFGVVAPIILNKRTNTVVGGHQRLTVLKDMGVTEVTCVIVDLDVAHEKALNVALNKISGAWDFDKLRGVFDDLKIDGFDATLTGFGKSEIENLFKTVLEDEIHDDDFDVDSELAKPNFSRAGDLWLLGRHKLFCGDSCKEDYLNVMVGKKRVNLILTDPPYNVNYQGKAGSIKNDNMSNEAFYQFLLDAFSVAYKSASPESAIYIFHPETEGVNFRQAMVDAGFRYGTCCIWNKSSFVLGRSPYQRKHEPCLYGCKKSYPWYSDKPEPTVWNIAKPLKNDVHPTMKPIPLLAIPILNSTMSNCVVLDPFGGSGSTLIACEQTGRICYTVELDEKFCDVIVKRYIEQVGNYDGVRVVRDGKTIPYAEVEGVSVDGY